MKDIIIRVKINNNQILTGVHCKGLDLSILDNRLTLIGILENVKQTELNKITTQKSISLDIKNKRIVDLGKKTNKDSKDYEDDEEI